MRSTILMKEASATLPRDGVPVTQTPSIFHVRYAWCMRTLLLASCTVTKFGIHPLGLRYTDAV